MRFLIAIGIIWSFSICQQAAYCQSPKHVKHKKSSGYCPPPKHIKLKKSKGYSMKAYKLEMREKAEARKEARALHKQLMKVYTTEGKEVEEMVDWDCPRPNSRHARQMKKQVQKRERMHEEALKKDRENSEGVLKDLKKWSDSQ